VSPARNEHVLGEDIPQQQMGCLADADARSNPNSCCAKAIFSNPQAGCGRGKIASVVAGARDAESFGQASGAASEPKEVARAMKWEVPSPCHFLDAQKRFQRAEKDRSGLPGALTGNIQTVVIAVDEINVGVAGGSEQD